MQQVQLQVLATAPARQTRPPVTEFIIAWGREVWIKMSTSHVILAQSAG